MNLMNAPAKVAEAKRLESVSDAELRDYVEDNVSGAAVLSSRGWGFCDYDQKCDLAYDEAKRRGRPELYEQGYKAASRSFGY